MIIYSVTMSLEREIEQDWLSWMLETHLPEVMQTGYFLDYRFHKILEPIVDPERINYNVLYRLTSLSELDAYRKTLAPALQEKTQQRFGEQALAIRSVLEEQYTGNWPPAQSEAQL